MQVPWVFKKLFARKYLHAWEIWKIGALLISDKSPVDVFIAWFAVGDASSKLEALQAAELVGIHRAISTLHLAGTAVAV